MVNNHNNISEYLKNHLFRQNLPGNYKLNSLKNTFSKMIIIGILNIILGLISLFTFYGINNFKLNYNTNTTEYIHLKPGIYNMYINIKGFYQNNLKYSKSINYNQLRGQTLDLNLKDCSPYDYTNKKPYYPAGLIANTFFQDIIQIKNLNINSENIAWGSQMKNIKLTNYIPSECVKPENWSKSTNENQNPLNTTENSGLPILDERFVNWIDISTFSDFKKLWGKITVNESKIYELKIKSISDYPKKGIYFTENSWLGIENNLIPYFLITIGFISLFSGIYIKWNT